MKNEYRLVFLALLMPCLLAGCVIQPPQNSTNQQPSQQPQTPPPVNQTSAQQITLEEAPTFICDMFGGQTRPLGVGGADLGIPIVNGSKQWLIFGDTFSKHSVSFKGPTGGAGASSIIESSIPFNCSNISWVTSDGSYFQPLHSARVDGIDASTVPAGAIAVNGTIYLYAMRVEHWSNTSDPLSTPAYGVLFRQEANGTFTEVTHWETNQPHVNTAPVQGVLPDGTPAIFMAVSGTYRYSPIDLAYVLPSDIENPAKYHYLTGYDKNGSPLWTTNIAEAKPIPGFENALAGEMSLVYDNPLKTYLLMFDNYQVPYSGFELSSSSTPYGPFSAPVRFFPCGTDGGNAKVNRPTWMGGGWGGCYGGYMLPDNFGADGHDLYFTTSVWVPYTTVILKMRINSSS